MFNCPQCEAFQDEAQIKERRDKYGHLYIPGFVIIYTKESDKENHEQEDSLSSFSSDDNDNDNENDNDD